MSDYKLQNSILVNEFTEESVRDFKVQFDELRQMRLPVIPIYIDSGGGEMYSLLAMLDIIEYNDIPVSTIALGKAMSAAAILLASGHPGLRFMGKHSTVMIHDITACTMGKIGDLKSDMCECERLDDVLYGILDSACGKKDFYFKKLVSKSRSGNLYIDAEKAKKYNIIDHIGIPVLEVNYSFEVIG